MNKNQVIRDRIIIGCLILAIVIVLGASVTIAWFAMSSETDVDNIKMNSKKLLFELKTSGTAGLYDSYVSRADNGYTTANTTESSSKIILRLINNRQMENLWQGASTPSSADYDRIQRIESTEYGLNPGDHGALEFSVVPRANVTQSFDVVIQPMITCFKTDYYTSDDTGHTPGYQKDVFEKMSTADSKEAAAIKFASSHICFFYMADENNDGTDEMHFIPKTGFRKTINGETTVTIYWAWPEQLSEVLEKNIEGIDASGAQELRKAFLANPDDYLEKINDSDNFSGIVVTASAQEAERETKAQTIMNSPSNYNFYSNRYNNADQTIGDKVGYIFLEIDVEAAGW